MPRLILLPLITLCLTLLFPHTLSTIGNGNAVLGLNSLENGGIDAFLSRGCNQKIGECFEEPEMESEISRRVLLMERKFISYETLKRDMVPCDKPGASYYSCTARAAHPYTRGCEVITRCARDIKDIKT
ncbi:Protein RALF-like 24 [Turnera subulata]|uniref:Protein RALF-like 24 n=1 Tax=Turnera subulata TaxID=218843 RepID=A0A9Q0GC44_9ROSI|nr:Protein RALF-like 24 [Turnera subulata]